MNGDVDILHHIGIAAANIEATVARYEKLGFVFTPLSLHAIAVEPGAPPAPFGTGNRCAIFESNYLEIVGVVDSARWSTITAAQRGPFDLDARLARYEGLHIMHFGADDVEVARARLLGQGTACSEVARLERAVDTPDGIRTMRAKSIHFPPGTNPEALIQIAQHETPELILQPRYMNHPNGAKSATETIVCADAPSLLAAKYARYAGRAFETKGPLHIVDVGRSRILVLAPHDLASIVPGAPLLTPPFLAGFTIAVESLARVRARLHTASIPFIEHDGRIIVGAESGGGSAVLFEPMGASRWLKERTGR